MTTFNREHLKQFRFKNIFNDLGWDLPSQQQPFSVPVGERIWLLDPVAYKRGVQILHCRPSEEGLLPEYTVRQKIERKVTSEVREHLIVFTDAAQTTQVWQWVSRVPGKPAQYREVQFRSGENPELLTQKLSRLQFALEDESLLTVLGVTQRLDDSAPREKVTKRFYADFEKQRKAFAAFIDGIPGDSHEQRWYTAVVIDRLMFLWFLQEKKFLDGQPRYLQNRLVAHLSTGHEQSFYKRFLSPLFFRGFALERTSENRAAIVEEFGNVPYLNGGLFAQHELEQRYGDALDIADAAFEKLFAFFDEWEWHLDERPLKSGKEINPDVLGYIFEKFVNQKQMGAYYTKEDITEYIGKNTIIPALLGKVRAEHPEAFDTLAWPMLQQSGDAYIYPAMLKGVDTPYPIEIAKGLDVQAEDLLERRKSWNRRSDEAVSLPTEIWRETITRHERTREVRAKLVAGELRDIGDLVTWNLDIRQFAQDLIESCTDVALLKSFWFHLAGRLPRQSDEKFQHGLSVLDPTCGSGAFLFAALNILKPLYDATLRTLQAVRADALITGDTDRPERWLEVDDILSRFAVVGLERVQDYAVIKHIIVHNLYGVDIEKQATEIAKLRLFLKLVALLEPGDVVEPLPDIDFNIRHGNTLVGYATADETERAVNGGTQGQLLFNNAWEDIVGRLDAVELQYNNFQIQQVQRGGHVTAAEKQKLANVLNELEEGLNHHLAKDYGVDPGKTAQYEQWKATHQPFHWYVDFYPLMVGSGFDVIVGNPPFVEVARGKLGYTLQGYVTAECGNLYAPVVERCTVLARAGWVGLVTPLSLLCTDRTTSLRKVISGQNSWVSSYDMRPGSLFEGVAQRLCILIASRENKKRTINVGGYRRWSSEERETLLATTTFLSLPEDQCKDESPWPKMASHVEREILAKMVGGSIAAHLSKAAPAIYVHRIVRYFVKALNSSPVFVNAEGVNGKSDDYKTLCIDEVFSDGVVACLNSSAFYWYWRLTSDGFHCGYGDIYRFPFNGKGLLNKANELSNLVQSLMANLQANSKEKTISTKTGKIRYQEFSPKRGKLVLDEIDKLIAGAWNLSPLMADFLINYDIKYRIGLVGETDDE